MSISTLQLALFLVASAVVGVVIGWLVRGANSQSSLEKLSGKWQGQIDKVKAQKDGLSAEISKLQSVLENQQTLTRQHEAAIAKGRTDLESAHEKTKLMSKDLFNLRAEREGFKTKVVTFQNALDAVKQQSTELQAEFIKSGEFYKRELAKSFDKRKALEAKVKNARLEQESFNNLLQASRSEHESVNNMLASAQNRLEQMQSLEQNIIKLEADNAQLNHDAIRSKQEIDALQREVSELDELKAQNKELAHCLKSMENSRKQYEDDAKRYRDHAGEHEKRSETLRVKLDEVEQNFADMEKQQRKALDDARVSAVVQEESKEQTQIQPLEQEIDDLKEIVGIGKVFEHTLHELGIFSFRQIANFSIADIARVNAELKEFKGRMEQDDWIGQAKELHFKKYG